MEQTFQYACPAAAHDGQARCRNMAPCATHGPDAPRAPRPDRVLVKVNLSKRWDGNFGDVRKVDRTPDRARKLGDEHEARAEKLGRNPFTIRDRRDGVSQVPEAADSGSPVFGPNGLQVVSVRNLVTELRAAGFRLTGAHRLARDWKPPVRLVLEFSRSGQDIQFPWKRFNELVATCFGQVDVWANDRDHRGFIVHTVNCGKRDDSVQPSQDLRYASGGWVALTITMK